MTKIVFNEVIQAATGFESYKVLPTSRWVNYAAALSLKPVGCSHYIDLFHKSPYNEAAVAASITELFDGVGCYCQKKKAS